MKLVIKKNGYSPEAVLEFGCGFGDINKMLSDKYNNYGYIGIDLIKGFVDKGKKHMRGQKLNLNLVIF